MTGLLQDARIAVRSLLRRPGFTSVAVLTIALAMGGVTAIFTVIKGSLLDPLPYADADRLVTLDVVSRQGFYISTSIANYETLIATAERRALRLGEDEAVPRISDLPGLYASMGGKIELEYAGTEKGEGEIIEALTRRAIKIVFDELVAAEDVEPIVSAFGEGWKVEVGDRLPSKEYSEGVDKIPGLREVIEKLGEARSPARIASAVEFVLEGLHLSSQLNRELQGERILYS